MQELDLRGIYKVCKSLILCLSVVGLTACECEDACYDNGLSSTPGNSSSNNSSSVSGNDGVAPSITYLDCSNLDPKKVYLLGSMSPSNGKFALVDVDDPTTFCTGFYSGTGLFISDQGYLSVQYNADLDGQVYKFKQDALVVEASGAGWNWKYPDNYEDNDESLFVPAAPTYDLYAIYDEATGSDIFYYQHYDQGVVYSSATGTDVYYSNPDDLSIIAVLPDGTLLMDKGTDLYIVDPELNQVKLTLPDAEEHFYVRASRLYINPVTGKEHLWIGVQDAEFMNDRRWSINTETWEIIDEGLFAALPEIIDPAPHINSNAAQPVRGKHRKIDGSGNLIQVGDYLLPPPDAVGDISSVYYNSVVVRRPIASSGEETTILHSDAEYPGDFNWKIQPLPFVHIFSGYLVTGN